MGSNNFITRLVLSIILSLGCFASNAQDLNTWQVVHEEDFTVIKSLQGKWVMNFIHDRLREMGKYGNRNGDTVFVVDPETGHEELITYYKPYKEGQWFYYDEEGNLEKITYDESETGEHREITPSTDKDSILADAKTFSPVYTAYHPNGKIASKGYYANGKWEGRYITYDTNGVMSQEDIYRQSVLLRSYFYYPNVKLKSRGTYADGEYDGEWEFYDENGNLSQKGNYKKGKQDGLWEYYDENEQKYASTVFKDGWMTKQTFYGPTGAVINKP
jgi:antitoxin component YwqK of YwqJK toxin-antitoxin module